MYHAPSGKGDVGSALGVDERFAAVALRVGTDGALFHVRIVPQIGAAK